MTYTKEIKIDENTILVEKFKERVTLVDYQFEPVLVRKLVDSYIIKKVGWSFLYWWERQ